MTLSCFCLGFLQSDLKQLVQQMLSCFDTCGHFAASIHVDNLVSFTFPPSQHIDYCPENFRAATCDICDTKKNKAEMCSMNWGGRNLSGTEGVERHQETQVKNEGGCHWEQVGRISWVFSNVSEQRRETEKKRKKQQL